MSIFNTNFKTIIKQLLPPLLRQDTQEGWLSSLNNPIQTYNNYLNQYITGSTSNFWLSGSTYSGGSEVIYIDGGVYVNISGSTSGITPTNSQYWLQISPSYIGANERLLYNSKTLVLEYALNRYFMLPNFAPIFTYSAITQSLFAASANTIYIETNTVNPNFFLMDNSGFNSGFMTNNSMYASNFMGNVFTGISTDYFTVYVPSSLNLTTNQITSFVNNYVQCGITYNVVFY